MILVFIKVVVIGSVLLGLVFNWWWPLETITMGLANRVENRINRVLDSYQ